MCWRLRQTITQRPPCETHAMKDFVGRDAGAKETLVIAGAFHSAITACLIIVV